MKKSFWKKKYLIEHPHEVLGYLQSTSTPYKKNIDQFYCDTYATFGVLGVRYDDEATLAVLNEDAALHILRDVTNDRRYKNRFVKLFGFPEEYDFDEQTVFTKCDRLADVSIDFTFMGGMSAQKVFKVLLYHETLRLKHAVQALLEDEGDALRKTYRQLKRIAMLLKISRFLFDTAMIDRLQNALGVLTCKERTALLDRMQSSAYQAFLWDIQTLLTEKSDFFLQKKGNQPLLFFIKKMVKKEPNALVKRLKKAIR